MSQSSLEQVVNEGQVKEGTSRVHYMHANRLDEEQRELVHRYREQHEHWLAKQRQRPEEQSGC